MAGVPLGFARFRPWYAALRTGAAFNPVALPDLLAYYDIRRTDTLFEDAAGNVPVDAATDPIGRWDAVGPSGAPNLTQGTAPSRPLYQLAPTRAEFDLLDDSLSVTLPAISGGQIVIVSPAGIWIDSLTFAGGAFTIGPSGYTGGPAGLLSLLSGDVTAVYILDEPLSVDDQAALVAFETARGSAGLITSPAEMIAGGDFESGLIGVKSEGSVSVSTYALNTVGPISGTQDALLSVSTPENQRPFVNFAGSLVASFTIGKFYIMSFDYKVVSGDPVIAGTAIGGPFSQLAQPFTLGATGRFSRIVSSSNAASNAIIYMGIAPAAYELQIDNVSVREVILP